MSSTREIFRGIELFLFYFYFYIVDFSNSFNIECVPNCSKHFYGRFMYIYSC